MWSNTKHMQHPLNPLYTSVKTFSIKMLKDIGMESLGTRKHLYSTPSVGRGLYMFSKMLYNGTLFFHVFKYLCMLTFSTRACLSPTPPCCMQCTCTCYKIVSNFHCVLRYKKCLLAKEYGSKGKGQ